jgi:hypothetical protein
MKTTGEHICEHCQRKYNWICHTSDKWDGKKLPEVVKYEKGVGYVNIINGKYVGRCPHCDCNNEFPVNKIRD